MDNPRLLISAYLDGELEGEALAEFERWLNASDANTAEFLRLSFDHQGVRTHLVAEQSARLMQDDENDEDDADNQAYSRQVMEGLVDQALAERRKHELEDLANQQLAEQQAADARNRLFARRRAAQETDIKHSPLVIPQPVIWLGLAAALGLAAWVVVALSPARTPTTPPTARHEQSPHNTDSTDRAQPAVVARLTGDVNARLQDGQRVASGTTLYEGQTIRLASGFVELTTEAGATVVLEGPCELALIEPGRFALAHGRIGVEDRNSNTQLTIQTPRGEVAHTQAAYGLSVGQDRATQVVCYGGRVELFATGGRSTTPDPFELVAGRVATAASGDLGMPTIARATVPEQSSFALSMDEAESPDFLYRRAVLASDPVAYWTFGGDAQRNALASQAVGGERLRLVGDARLTSQNGRHWLDIPASGPDPAYAELTSGYDALSGAEAYTVECWVRPREWSEAALVSLSVERLRLASDAPSAMVLHLHEPNLAGQAQRTLRFVHRNPPAIEGPNEAVDTTPYPANEWLHLAAVKTRDELRVYVNGQLVASQPDRTPMTDEPLRLLMGYHFTGDSSRRQFDGGMDEVAFYRHALTDGQITDHFEAGKPLFELTPTHDD